jgi:DNA-binding Lrp family transcriptional regulator
MEPPAEDWRSGLDAVDAALIDGYQSGFPVEQRPFRAIGEAFNLGAEDVLARVRSLLDRGILRRFGPVLNPPVIGSSTLAALRVPPERFDAVADLINEYPQVNHNYRRDHAWNMWFVVTAGSKSRRDEILQDIEHKTGLAVLNLPMLTDYYIDLEFPVVNSDRFARESLGSTAVDATHISEEAAGGLSTLEARLLLAIQDGLPLSATPYADVAAELAVETERVLAGVDRLLTTGCIKRVGCVVNHVVTGFENNCMVVWNVPDGQLNGCGTVVGELPYVTLCYHRPRRPKLDWQYNLFTMIHGREAAAVEAKIDELATEYLPFDHERLYSTETLKQTGARYEDLVSTEE